jgi:lipopolysaccharide transport system ATP-binding protein
MSDVVIQVDRLSKQYRLGTIGGKRLVDDVNRWWAKLRGKEDPLSKVGSEVRSRKSEAGKQKSEVSASVSGKPTSDLRPPTSGSGQSSSVLRPPSSETETLWALKDVSFEVKQGEILGIIGRNGAGKSTLLKILSRVTAPTSGEVRVKGRIASLLEVGTGFHPELTGRENIFLNGAILGMTKAETRKKLDEIVAFAEIEKFLDTPVKRYSSGMYVRLAFAVAAHLEPEILIVDEVLAVGDTEFQKKCLGKMQDVAGHGRTVLFVSHNMAVMQQLCSMAILLETGAVKFQGRVQTAVDLYLKSNDSTSKDGDVDLSRWRTRRDGDYVRIQCLKFLTLSGTQKTEFIMGESVQICIEVEYSKEVVEPDVGFALLTNQRQPLFASAFSDCCQLKKTQPGVVKYTAVMDPCQLMPGTYLFALAVTRKGGEAYDFLEDVPGFNVLPIQSEKSVPLDYRWGSLFFHFPWKAEPLAVGQPKAACEKNLN